MKAGKWLCALLFAMEIAARSIGMAGEVPFPGTPGVYSDDYYTYAVGASDAVSSAGDWQFSGRYSGIDIEAGGSLTIQNGGNIVVGNGFTVDNNGTLTIDGRLDTGQRSGALIGMVPATILNHSTGVLNFDANAIYVNTGDNYNHILNGGVVNIRATDQDTIKTILSVTSLMNGGVANLYSQVSGFILNDMIGSHDYDGAVVLKNANHVFTEMVDVRYSRLDASEVGGEFRADVISGREDLAAIKTGKTTDFYAGVHGNLTVVDGTTTFKDGSSYDTGLYYYNGKHWPTAGATLTVAAGATLVNETDFTLNRGRVMTLENSGTVVNDKSMVIGAEDGSQWGRGSEVNNKLGATFTNNGSLTFGEGSLYFTNAGTLENNGLVDFGENRVNYDGAGNVDNKNTISASSETLGLEKLVAATDLSDAASVFNITYLSHDSAMEQKQLAFRDSTAGSTVNLIATQARKPGSFDGNALTDLDAKNSDVVVTGDGYLSWGHGVIDTTGTFTVEAGATLYSREESSITSPTGGTIAAGGVRFDGTVIAGAYGVLDITAPVVEFGATSVYTPEIHWSGNNGAMKVNGDIDVETGARLVLADGVSTASLEGKAFVTVTGAVDGEFANDRYNFIVKTVGGERVVMLDDGKPVNSTEEIYEKATGGGSLSGAAADAGKFIDKYLDDAGADGEAKSSLDQFVQNMSNYDAATLAKGMRALSGENAVHASAPMRLTATRFLDGLGDRMNAYGNRLYGGDYLGGDACAPTRGNGIWAGAFGDWSKTHGRNGADGYRYDFHGFMLGYERRHGNWRFGVAGAYSNGDLDIDGNSGKTDVDTLNLGVYASYARDGGFFATAIAAFSHGWNDASSHSAIFGKKTGSYDTQAYSASIEAGRRFSFASCFNFIPSVGVRYSHIRRDRWTEKAATGVIRNWYAEDNDDLVEIPVMARLNRVFRTANATVIPEVRAGWIYTATDPKSSIRTGFVGSNASMTVSDGGAGRSRFSVGGGVTARFAERFDASVDYSYEARSGYRGHNVSASIGLSF